MESQASTLGQTGLRNWSLAIFVALTALLEGPAQIAGLLAVVLCLSHARWEKSLFGWSEGLLLIWLLAGLPGLFYNDVEVRSSDALRPLACIVYLAGRCTPRTGNAQRLLAWGFLGAITLNGLYGLVQVFIVNPPLEQMVLTRTASQHFVNPDDPSRLMMASGLFYNRVKLAHVGVLGLAAACALTLSSEDRIRKYRPILVLSILILASAVYLSYRRAAPAAMFFAFLVWAFIVRRKRVLAFACGACVVFGSAFLLMETGRARLAAAAESFSERVLIYESAWNLFADHFWLGVGHGAYRHSIVNYATSSEPDVILNLQSQAHNLFLHVFTESGLIGGFAFTGVIGLCLYRASVNLREQKVSTQIGLLHVSFLCVVILTAIGGLHFVLYHNPVALAFWYCLGVCAGYWPSKQDISNAEPTVARSL
ncbi:MAG: O-antigen ligase family protein [Myxococcota bacterium]|nr:O-antigen ligase family protein [Myxococcota bacterium]